MTIYHLILWLIDEALFQSHDTQEAVWGGGQPAPGGGQRAGAFSKVYGYPSNTPALWEVSTHSHSIFSFLSSFFSALLNTQTHKSDLNQKCPDGSLRCPMCSEPWPNCILRLSACCRNELKVRSVFIWLILCCNSLNWMVMRIWRSCLCLPQMQHRKEICSQGILLYSSAFSGLFVQWREALCPCVSPAVEPLSLQASRLVFVKTESGPPCCSMQRGLAPSHCLFMLDSLIKLLVHKQRGEEGCVWCGKLFPRLFQCLNVYLERPVASFAFACSHSLPFRLQQSSAEQNTCLCADTT